ncbi:branched-chain amino acid ABC transporter permease [Acidisoma cellulosilytica]|uniref:Branched-chain amino acid ABC transporter permease n=1 Tax=Acidisoma cellulosilyticum TaxID=2802395 RepID=A0A963Z7B6_9PROT|nr:branched-chain amino acid ABC transporter permease [Acidisoma cellulosilyticum]MCB8883445.1 branched-chain amino acid ABC transporter permease [Acidisoma cellulosilyticum]
MIFRKLKRAETSGGIWGPIAVVVAGLVLLVGAPMVTGTFGLLQLTVFAALAIFALAQGFIWGFGGILCFGQSAFLGLGGYAYAVGALNMTDTTGAVALAIIVPMLFAALLGYFMFYGRISDAYIGVITLTVAIILFDLFNSTSGDIYHIGQAPLGGFNGIPSVPPLNIPGDPDAQLDTTGLWYAAMGALILCYIMLKWILATRFGRVVVAIRENETRAQLLGYDPRLFKLLTFVIGAGISGVAGCLYTNWGAFISPTVFSLTMSAQVIIYVLVGGLGTLVGPIFGAVGIQYLINLAGGQHVIDPNLLLGIVLVAFVLLVPQGVVPVIRNGFRRLMPVKSPGPALTPSVSQEVSQ